MRRLTAREVAERLRLSIQRVNRKIHQGHFPGCTRCECGLSFLIPEIDLKLKFNRKKVDDRK